MPDIPKHFHEQEEREASRRSPIWIDGCQIHESRITQAFVPPTDALSFSEQDQQHALSFLFARTLLSILTMIEIDTLFTCLLPQGDGWLLLLLFACAMLATGLVQYCLATLLEGLVQALGPRLAGWLDLLPPEPVELEPDRDKPAWWEDDLRPDDEMIEETDGSEGTDPLDILPRYEYGYQPNRKGETCL